MKEMADQLNITENYMRKKKFECKKKLIVQVKKDPLYIELMFSSDSDDIRKIVS